ncbi:MAG: acyltransferase [Candidatus Omnitrophica bacterium]|nr:dTDP-4-amino-4,6-dideoxy-D-glucose acyltransferase [bacterium]NUN97009.1 acyltransferase [Candidatus Omnitrophota bacterium]
MTTDNYTPEELRRLGIRFGEDVCVHRTVQLFGDNVTLGSHVRIDCFSLITSREPVVIGSHVHIAAGVYLFGSAGIVIEDYCGLSSRCSIYTTSDDYSEGHLTNPTVPDEFRKVLSAPVRLERHAIIGCGSVIMPGVVVRRGAAVGALSFVNKSVPEFAVVTGAPLRRIGSRNRERLESMESVYEEKV